MTTAFVSLDGRLCELDALSWTLSEALEELLQLLPEDLDPCTTSLQLFAPGSGWADLTPLEFSTARLAEQPAFREAAGAALAPWNPKAHGGSEASQWSTAGWCLDQLCARVLGCPMDCALHVSLRGARVVLYEPTSSSEASGSMVVSFRSAWGEKVSVRVRTTASVCDLKEAVFQQAEREGPEALFWGLPPGMQDLSIKGRLYADEDRLSDQGVTDGSLLDCRLRFIGGAGDNLELLRQPDPYRRTAWRAMDCATDGVSPPQGTVQLRMRMRNIQLGEHPSQNFGPAAVVDANMQAWASGGTGPGGFELRVELMPRLAWSPPTASGARPLRVWPASSLVTLALCLRRRGLPPGVVAQISDLAASAPESWLNGGGTTLPGRTLLHTDYAADGRVSCITATFAPAVPLPLAGRLRISSPDRPPLRTPNPHYPCPGWPATEWQVQLSPEGEVPSPEPGFCFWNLQL